MRKYFRQEKDELLAGAAGQISQVASALVIFGLCYVLTSVDIGTGGSLLKVADNLARNDVDVHEKFSAVADIGKMPFPGVYQQCDYGVVRKSSWFDATPSDQSLLKTTHTPAAMLDLADSSNISMTISLTTPDRHWRMAEAFNAVLDHKRQIFLCNKPLLM